MQAQQPYVVSLFGSEEDLARLRASSEAAAEHFLVTRADAEHLESIGEASPDVAVLGAGIEKPLPLARQVRLAAPQSQILFLLPGERLEGFRAKLPFVPNLASAWTASIGEDSQSLGMVLVEAAKAARRRSATESVLGRINQRLAERKSAPAEARGSQLALSERYLATILTQSPDGFVAVDRQGSVIAFNDAATDFFGKDIEGSSLLKASLLPEEERDGLRSAIGRAAAGEALFHVELRLETDSGDHRHAELLLAPVEDQQGGIASVSITARDISERKKAEERQRLLISELNHRVKNTLAIVQALAQQSFRGDRGQDEQRAAFGARLSALAAAHDLLTSQSWRSASLGDLVRSSLHSCGAAGEQFEAGGPEVVLPPQTAVSLAIAFHELCTNAIKYGALSKTGGKVRIKWNADPGSKEAGLRLEWIESGGPPVEAPARRGFGLKMLERGLASELDGKVFVEFTTGGLVCRIEAPLPEKAD